MWNDLAVLESFSLARDCVSPLAIILSALEEIPVVNFHTPSGLRISLIQIVLEKPIYKAASIKMINSGAIGQDPKRDPSRAPLGTSGEVQNIDFSKILGMASPGVEYFPTCLTYLEVPSAHILKNPKNSKLN